MAPLTSPTHYNTMLFVTTAFLQNDEDMQNDEDNQTSEGDEEEEDEEEEDMDIQT